MGAHNFAWPHKCSRISKLFSRIPYRLPTNAIATHIATHSHTRVAIQDPRAPHHTTNQKWRPAVVASLYNNVPSSPHSYSGFEYLVDDAFKSRYRRAHKHGRDVPNDDDAVEHGYAKCIRRRHRFRFCSSKAGTHRKQVSDDEDDYDEHDKVREPPSKGALLL